jgi:hypothetical protein
MPPRRARTHAGCSDGADAAFAHLPLASITEIGPMEWAPDGTHWRGGQHGRLSLGPTPGALGWQRYGHRHDDGPDRITMSWEPPAPF